MLFKSILSLRNSHFKYFICSLWHPLSTHWQVPFTRYSVLHLIKHGMKCARHALIIWALEAFSQMVQCLCSQGWTPGHWAWFAISLQWQFMVLAVWCCLFLRLDVYGLVLDWFQYVYSCLTYLPRLSILSPTLCISHSSFVKIRVHQE